MTKNQMNFREQRISSLDIAAVTGKQHKDVLKAIRNMEPAWEKECGRKFALTSEKIQMPQGGVRLIPVFELTKTESLYVATKFNDEACARLVMRWVELERMHNGDSAPRLLVTEAELVSRCDDMRRRQIAEENAEAESCLTLTQLARMLHVPTKELNRWLVRAGVQRWEGGRYRLTREYEGCGMAEERSFHYYALDGEKKERRYLVWTRAGVELICKMMEN